jgi:uncharacterized membrane protein
VSFETPQWWLLGVPLLLLWGVWLRRDAATRWIRLAVLALAVLALTGPRLSTRAPGATWVVLIDRSASVHGQAAERARALLPELERAARESHGALYVVGVGRGASLLAAPGDGFEGLQRIVEHDDSDLAAGLELAASYVPPNAAGELVLISDGLYTAEDPRLSAAPLRARGIRVHVLPVGEVAGRDSAITRVLTPPRATRGQRFAVAVEVQSPRAQTGKLLLRDGDGRVLAEQAVELAAGTRRYALPLAAEHSGVQALEAVLEVAGDPRPGNNRARAAVEVAGPPRMLIYNAQGSDTALVRALASSGLELDLRAASTPLTLAALQGAAALVLENVALSDLGDEAGDAIADYVQHMGGGLLITGGRSSYALGGYFHSALDPLLPVAMDRQQELRRPRLDMAIALDRSGSMAVEAQNGQTKMALANRAAAEAINLLAPGDGVMVLAVDTAAHVVVRLQTLDSDADRARVAERIQKIESSGGGIYVYTALATAIEGLLHGAAETRHVVLFSDAADSEEPGAYRQLIARFRSAGGSLSVIGLGTPDDPDAELLRDIAKLGGGNVYFTTDARQLPRVFAQDVMYVARKTFLEERTRVRPARGLLGLGLGASEVPDVGGYNLTFLRTGAEPMLISGDEHSAALAAGWQRGTGKVLAVMFEADGPFTGELAGWSDYKPFFRGALEWLKRPDAPDGIDAELRIHGRVATIDVELAPDHEGPPPSRAWLLSTRDGESKPIALRWSGPRSLSASFPAASGNLYQAVVENPGTAPIELPPATLPYSPELALRSGDDAGEHVLTELARATDGSSFTSVEDLKRTRAVAGDAQRSLAPWLAGALLLLVLLDIAHRRGLFDARLNALRTGFGRRTHNVRMRLRRSAAGSDGAARADDAAPGAEAGEPPGAPPGPKAPESATPPAEDDPLVQAKRRARRR